MKDLRPLLDPAGNLKNNSLVAGDINNQGVIISTDWIAVPTGKYRQNGSPPFWTSR